jgi:Protein of unknown function, DUF547
MRTLLQRVGIFFLLAALSACSTLVRPPAVAVPTVPAAHAAWARVLQEFVNEQGEVDFSALSQKRADLDAYVSFVAQSDLQRMTEGARQDERLAHMINAYNALSMFNVLESGIPDTHAGWRKVKFFALRDLTIGGAQMSLYKFENDVIRPYTRLRADPRVHFALNCSAVSCPVLPREPFTAVNLDSELERETRAFFAKPDNFRIDSAHRTVWLSEILKFYPEDFVPSPAKSLAAYALSFAPTLTSTDDIADYAVRFTPYNWTVANSRRRR